MDQEITRQYREPASADLDNAQVDTPLLDVSPDLANSPALQRLLDEVRNDDLVPYMAHYNRTHNRHNR